MNSPLKRPKVAPDLVWRLLDGNAVVVSPRFGEVRVFNRVGTVIWQNLIDGNSPSAIEEYLVTNFEVSRLKATTDLHVFINDLTERGIITWEISEV